MIPEISIYLARFWGSLFMILGFSSFAAGFLKRVIKYTNDKTITISTGYITFLLGLFTASQIISYALVAESSDASITATAVSIVSILIQSGYVLYQNIFSALLLKHGDVRIIAGVPTYSLHDYQFAALILPVGLVLAILILFGLRETYCRHVQG